MRAECKEGACGPSFSGSTKWNPFAARAVVISLEVCFSLYDSSARPTMMYLPAVKHLTWGISVIAKDVVLRSLGRVPVWVYLIDRSFEAIVGSHRRVMGGEKDQSCEAARVR